MHSFILAHRNSSENDFISCKNICLAKLQGQLKCSVTSNINQSAIKYVGVINIEAINYLEFFATKLVCPLK